MDSYPFFPLKSKIDGIAKELRKFYKTEYGESYSLRQVRKSIELMIAKRGEAIVEDNGEVLMVRGRPEFDELRELLQGPQRRALAREAIEKLDQLQLYVEAGTRFNGYVPFSPKRMNAMVVHLAARCRRLTQTRLNKLLFYADFSSYTLRGQGISGAEYIKLTHGPVFPGYKNTIDNLREKRQIRTEDFRGEKSGKNLRSKKSYRRSTSDLSEQELKLIDWVIQTYDHLSTKELIAISHREMAYWETNWLQPIDYNLAEHLEINPPEGLLDG